jgi:glycine cleavage system H protein
LLDPEGRSGDVVNDGVEAAGAFAKEGSGEMYPSEYLYSREHEWVRVDNDICTLGVTEFAQHELGEVVFVELPEAGQVFNTNDELGTIESVKAVAEVFSPVAGEIVEVNDAVVDDPEMLNDDPHGEGWLVKIRFSSADDLKALMTCEQYEEYVKSGEA